MGRISIKNVNARVCKQWVSRNVKERRSNKEEEEARGTMKLAR